MFTIPHQPKAQEHAFALLVSLLLVTMLAATGAGLTLFATTESIRADYVALDLDHRLAADSLLVALPKLLAQRSEGSEKDLINRDTIRLEAVIGSCHVRCAVRPESGKLYLGGRSTPDGYQENLRNLARTNGLPPENIAIRPILGTEETREWPKFLWFDQIVCPTELNEIFHWEVLTKEDEQNKSKRKTWSDLVTFWNARGRILALDLTTSIGTDMRRWYWVISVSEGRVEVLYRGAKET